MISKKDKDQILKALKNIDVKKLQLDHPDEKAVKWFRFGSFIGIDIVTEMIKTWPEEKPKNPKVIKINVT